MTIDLTTNNVVPAVVFIIICIVGNTFLQIIFLFTVWNSRNLTFLSFLTIFREINFSLLKYIVNRTESISRKNFSSAGKFLFFPHCVFYVTSACIFFIFLFWQNSIGGFDNRVLYMEYLLKAIHVWKCFVSFQMHLNKKSTLVELKENFQWAEFQKISNLFCVCKLGFLGGEK